MKVIVDTSVWSLVLRRRNFLNPEIENKLLSFIDKGEIILLGPIRQEILSGIKEKKQFDLLKEYLRAFPNFRITLEEYEMAAELFNECRKKGIQGSNIDFLICAVAVTNDLTIYSIDNDFKLFQKYLPIKLES